MNNDIFKEKYYNPYIEVWKCLKIIQFARKHFEDAEMDKANDEVWEMYKREVNRIGEKYKDNPFGQDLVNLLLKYDEVIAKYNQEHGGEHD